MWKVSYLVGSIFFISYWTFCCASQKHDDTENDEVPLKMHLVEEIVRKVCNLSLSTFSNKNPQEKAKLMIKIEEKLNKSAQSLGDSGIKYVKLIMKGVRSKTFENQQNSDIKNVDIKTHHLRAGMHETKPKKATKPLKSKDELMNNIANRIELLAKAYLYSAKTERERKEAIEFIKNKLVKSADRKHSMKHSKPEEIKSYVNFVAKGIEAMMHGNAKTNERRMEYSYTNNIDLKGNINKDSQDYNSVLMGLVKPLPNKLDHIGSDIASKYKSVSFNIDKKNEFKSPFNTKPTEKFSCNDAMKETCRKIKLVQMFHCLSDRKEIHVMQLCDGVGDCSDFSDEKNCAKQAIESIHSANLLMTHIQNSLSHRCFPDLVDENMIAKQNIILKDVLQNQLSFIHEHSVVDSSKYSRRVFTADTDANRQTVHEAVNVVDALALALDSTICSKVDKNTLRRQGEEEYIQSLQHIDDVLKTSTWAPEFCKCDGQNCIKSCTSSCKKICWEIYSLTVLQCDSVTGENTVSLDMICDGKLDCYDELDEKDCSQNSVSKFQATQMYNYVLNDISAKASSMRMDDVKKKLLSLHALVLKLQKLSLKRNADLLEVKRLRDASFAELSAVYKVSLDHVDSAMDTIDTYVNLITINERLLSALKRSNTGNDKIISSNNCLCRGYQCALPRCEKACIHMCSVEPMLTRYFCSRDSYELNNSVPIELVCNGRKNCPNGDDEKDCKKDVCRAHHYVVLRHNIRDVGENQQGTSLGEALKSWRLKVTSSLKVAESNERPTQVELREVVHDVLRDLVMAYATINTNSRSDIFQEFYMWARVVMDLLKSCSL